MNIDEFRAELESEIQNAAINFGQSPAATFAEKITDMMREAEYLNGDFQESFFTGTHPKRHSNLRVDGWLQDAADNSLVLFVVHYGDGNENMIKTTAEKNFKMLEAFVDAVTTSDLELEESTSIAELSDILRTSTDAKFKFILLTNARPAVKRNDIKNFFVRGNEVDCQIWDIERIFAVYSSLQVREPVTINFSDCGGLPCLRATNADNCESFLCVIPGKNSLAIFHHALKEKFPAAELNLQVVWKAQEFPAAFEKIFETITLAVNDFITGDRPITNVTQWCKQAACWSNMKVAVRVELPENFSAWMIDSDTVKAEKKSARKIQQISFEVDAQSKVLSLSVATWRKISVDAAQRKLLSPDEKSALTTAMKIPAKIPSPPQCEKLLRLLNRLEENGLTYSDETP